MSNIGNPPCDVGVIRSHRADAPCEQRSRPWVLLGIFVFLVFSGGLDARVQNVDLSPQAREQLEAEKVNLGGAQVPAGASEETAVEIERVIQESFLASFRFAMFVAAGLAVAGAVAAAVMIEGKGSTAPGEKVGRPETAAA